MDLADARGKFGVLGVEEDRRVHRFNEKPTHPEPLPDAPGVCAASMGIYVFRPQALEERLSQDAQDAASDHDFGHTIVPGMVSRDRVFAFPFERGDRSGGAYWRDVGTLPSYWQSHMDLLGPSPLFSLHDRAWPLHTHFPMDPPAMTVSGRHGIGSLVTDSILSPGCIVEGSEIVRSVLSPRVHVGEQSRVEDSILMEGVTVGRGCRVRGAILDKGATITDGAVIEEHRKDGPAERPRHEGERASLPRRAERYGTRQSPMAVSVN